MFGLGDLVIILSVAFIASNRDRVPELWKSVGECKKAFRSGLEGPSAREVGEYREALPTPPEQEPAKKEES